MTATPIPYDCDAFDANLSAYLERELGDAERAALERHVASCERCANVLADVSAIRSEARALPALTPSRDLWSGIEARIAAPVIELGTRRTAPERSRVWLGAAAAALVFATAGVTYVATHVADQRAALVASTGAAAGASTAPITDRGADSTIPAPAVTRGGMQPVQVALSDRPQDARVVVEQVEHHAEKLYGREISTLEGIIATRRSELDPRTLAIIQTNLTVIEHAIEQTRAALQKDPASHFLLEQLNSALDTKVELLRTAAQLPARS